MNSRLEETESKWTCEYCTYANWPSSLKCTMCRGAKPLLGEDIYRLRDPSPQRASSNVASGPVTHHHHHHQQQRASPIADPAYGHNYSQNVPSAGKWSCGMCTYLNYQNTTRCVQCGNRRPVIVASTGAGVATNTNAVVTGTGTTAATITAGTTNTTTAASATGQSIHSLASNLHEHLAPLRLADGPPNSGSNNSQSTPVINLHPERAYYNVQQQQQANIHPEKWSCHACTYENWPKATKCVMCGQPKDRDNRRDNKSVVSNLGVPSPERDHGQQQQRGLPSPPHAPYIHQTQREDNSAIGRR